MCCTVVGVVDVHVHVPSIAGLVSPTTSVECLASAVDGSCAGEGVVVLEYFTALLHALSTTTLIEVHVHKDPLLSDRTSQSCGYRYTCLLIIMCYFFASITYP